MRKVILLGSLGFVALVLQSLGDPKKSEDMLTMKASYEKSMNAIISNYAASVKSWPEDYVSALKALQSKMQKDGDLDGWQAAKTETARFLADPKIEDGAISAHTAVQAVQDKYRNIPRQLSLDKNQKITALSQKHLAKLTALQTDLTKQGKMEDAMAVNAEIKRVNGSPEVSAAEFDLSEQEARTAQLKKDAPPPPNEEKPKPVAKAPEAKAPEPFREEGGVRIYDGKAPSLPGVTFKSMRLIPTTAMGAKRKLNVSAMMSSDSDASGHSSASVYGSSKSSYGSTSSRVRVGMKTVASGSVLSNLIVVVEYYSKELKTTAGKIVPEKMLFKRIAIPNVTTQGVWIDCPEASVYKSSYKSTSSYGSSYHSKSGREFYGIVLSVFETDKTIAYQAVTGSTLDELAPTELPNE